MSKIWHKQYDPGVPVDINTKEYSSINDLLESGFRKYGAKPAFHNMGKTLSYHEIDILSKKFASYLQNDLKLSKGDRVAIMMPNILQYPIALFGILRAGMVAVNVNPLYTARELEHQLKDSEAKAIVIFANSAHVLEKIIANTEVKQVIVTQIGDMLKVPKKYLVNFVIKRVKKMVPAYKLPGSITFEEVLSRGDVGRFQKSSVEQSDIAFLQYTGNNWCGQRGHSHSQKHSLYHAPSTGVDKKLH